MLVNLDKKVPRNLQIKRKQLNLTNSQRVLKGAIKCGISEGIIKSMNYLDLQILILDLHIDTLSKTLFELRQIKLKKNGIDNIQEASEEDFNNL